jgi:sugar transferase (PEP-CTERM/EpsH1 system associated)
MREILFLAHRIPYPPDRGDKIRSWNILKHLGTLGTVHLACFADDEADAAHLGALRSAMNGSLGEAHVEVRRRNRFAGAAQALASGKPVSLTMFDSQAVRRFVGGMLQRPGLGSIYAFSGQMAQFVPTPCRQHFVMDFVDMDSAKFAEYAGGGPMRWVHAREAETLFAFERATAARADLSLFVSDAEAALFRARAPEARVAAVSNGIDLDLYDPEADFLRVEAPARPLIVFTGQMDYRPNIEAVTAFAEEAMPAIRHSHPTACFAIVGRNPPPAVLRLVEREGVVVTGAVADVRSWLAAADIVVAPLRIARGIQNKVLEAMAMARPVVASPAAFEGIDAEPGRDLIVASDEGAAILDLLSRPAAAAAAIGLAARSQMDKSYRWSARLAPLAAMLAPQREAA